MIEGKIRWGILATGFIANQFASDLKYCENSELVAVASRNEKSAKAFAEKHGASIVCHSYEELAKSNEVDVIYIATPHHLHYPNAKLCLEHGKHVLCEKPLTVNAELSKSLVAIAKKNHCFLMEAMWTRFFPAVKHALELVEKGALGQLRHLVSDFGFKADRDPEHRLFNRDYGGGSLLDVGIYPLALSYFFMGKPKDISSHLHMGPTQVDEQCSMNLGYGDASAQLFSSITIDTGLKFSLVGDKGSLEFKGPLYAPTGLVIKIGDVIEEIDLKFNGNGYQFEAMAVEQALAKGELQVPEVNWELSIELAKMMDHILAHGKKDTTMNGFELPKLLNVT